MKKFLTHLFVILTNFYILTYILGLIMMFFTITSGPINPVLSILTIIFTFVICIIYENIREKFKFRTFGESLIGNFDKSEILIQEKTVSITRIPLFLLILFTLAVNGNLLDGLSEGQVYTFVNIFLFGIVAASSYFGIKYFMENVEILPLIALIAGLILTGYLYKYSSGNQEIGVKIFYFYLVICSIWFVTGIIYNIKRIKN